jgi:hypothetical protein
MRWMGKCWLFLAADVKMIALALTFCLRHRIPILS